MRKIIILFMLLVCVSFALGTTATDLNAQALLYYKLEETGVPYVDEVGTINFTLADTPTRIASIINFGQDQEETNDNYLQTVTDTVFEQTDFTWNLWFKPESSTTHQQLISYYLNDGGNYKGCYLYFYIANVLSLTCYTGTGTGNFGFVTSTTLNDGDQYMLTLTHDGTTPKMFINSVEASYSARTTGSVGYKAGGHALRVGGDSVTVATIDGIIDEISYYDDDLTQTEINYLYNGGTPGVSQQYPYTGAPVLFSTTLIYPLNSSTYYGDYNGSIVLSLSDVNGTASCYVNNTDYTLVGGPTFGNETIQFINNTEIIEDIVYFSYFCNDTGGAWSNGTGIYFNKYNLLNMSIYDSGTGNLTTGQTINALIYNNLFYNSSYSTNNGTLSIRKLNPGIYTGVFTSVNYSTSSYTFTQGYGEATYLNVYLVNSTASVIFTITDKDNGEQIDNATITIKKYVSDVLTIVNVLKSDVTGRVTFTYEPGKIYVFTVSKSGYADKTFTLNPIIFATYTVRLYTVQSVIDNTDFAGVNLYHAPKIFYSGLNNFTLTVSEPNGGLQYYGFNITFPGGAKGLTGISAQGGILPITINITGAVFGDRVFVTNYYKLVTGDLKTFKYQYEIIPEPLNYTFVANSGNTYGLGEFERSFITVLISTGSGGLASMFIGATGGLAVGVLIMSYFAYAGFISYWLILIPVFGAVLIIIWRGSQ